MRYLYLLPFSLLFFGNSFAQKKKEPKDGIIVDKVTYSDIVKVDSTSRFDLFNKAAKWVESQKSFEIEEEDALAGKIVAKSKFIVYSERGVLAKPNGDFRFDMVIDIKDGKYRYTFTNFIYRHYKQNRQDLLKYEPVRGDKPIEDTKAAGWSKQWGKNKLQVGDKINAYISSLRAAMKYVAPNPNTPSKPKEEW